MALKNSLTDISIPQVKLDGIFRGVVEENNDPLKAGRCKVRVVGVHTDDKDLVPTENLVWAQPACPIFGGVSKIGVYGVPIQGSHVFLFFEAGNIMEPRYFATAPGIPEEPPDINSGFNDPDGIYPLEPNEPDWNEGSYTTTYPNAFVIEDKSGNQIILDSTEGSEQIVLQHGKSNTRLVFKTSGGLVQEAGEHTGESYFGEKKEVIGADNNIMVVGKETKTMGEEYKSVLGDKKEYVAGSADVSVTGIENKTSGGMAWNIKGDSSYMTAGESSFVSDSETLIKSNSDNVKLNAKLMNIELSAQLGNIKSTSMTYEATATLTATLKGQVSTTVGDGMITTVNGSAMTMIKGGVILIG